MNINTEKYDCFYKTSQKTVVYRTITYVYVYSGFSLYGFLVKKSHVLPQYRSYILISESVATNRPHIQRNYKDEQSCDTDPLLILYLDSEYSLEMSLCESRKRTTAPASFRMGVMSTRHQNGSPAEQIDY